MTEQKNPIGHLPIDLTFTVDQANDILHTLAHLPFHQVAPVMKMIQDQAIPQAHRHEEALTNVSDVIEKAKATEKV
jgi:hypothetical protein